MKRDLERELGLALTICEQARKRILHHYAHGYQMEIKEDGTKVTDADKRVNQLIIHHLSRCYPNDAIVSEEAPALDGQRTWYVDPIDGTEGFYHRSDQFAIHIGLCEEDTPVLGVVAKPTTGEAYVGIPGQCAYRINTDGSKTPLRITPRNDGRLIGVMGLTYLDSTEGQVIAECAKLDKIVRHGSEGLRMMKIAENIADVLISRGNDVSSTWDLCAPQAVLEAAGGKVGLIGAELRYTRQRLLGKYHIAASSQEQFDLLQERLAYLEEPDT